MASVAENHLAHILAEQRDAGKGVPRPADHSAVASLQHYVIQQLEAELAPGYVDFLAEANGLDFNGTVLYAAGSPGAEQSRDILEFRKLLTTSSAGAVNGPLLYMATHRSASTGYMTTVRTEGSAATPISVTQRSKLPLSFDRVRWRR